MEFGEPARNFRPRPQAAVIRRRLDPLLKRSQRLGRQDRRLCAVADALVAERRGSALVVALDQRPHPPRRERQQFRHLLNLISRGQKPQRMKVALADKKAAKRMNAPKTGPEATKPAHIAIIVGRTLQQFHIKLNAAVGGEFVIAVGIVFDVLGIARADVRNNVRQALKAMQVTDNSIR